MKISMMLFKPEHSRPRPESFWTSRPRHLVSRPRS